MKMCFYLFLFCGVCFTETPKISVAVSELEATGVSTNDAKIITDRLRAEMINTGAFRVMERGQMEAVLKEQAFQESGICNTSECQVEIGQFLGVEKMVVGVVGQLGELYTISARMLDVETGEILFSVNRDYEGKISALLTKAIPIVAVELAEKSGFEVKGEKKAGIEATSSEMMQKDFAQDSLEQAPQRAVQEASMEKEQGGNAFTVLFSLIAIGAGGYGVYQDMELGDLNDKADQAKRNYDAAIGDFQTFKSVYEAARTKAEDAKNKRNIAYGIGGGGFACMLISLAF